MAGVRHIEADFYLFFTHCVMDSFKFILSYKIHVALIRSNATRIFIIWYYRGI